MAKVVGSLLHDIRSAAVDVCEPLARAMPSHHVEARRVELGDIEEAPFKPFGLGLWRLWQKAPLARRVGAGEVGDDRRALADCQVSILQKRNFLPRIERGALRCLGLPGPREYRTGRIRQPQLVQRPMRLARDVLTPQGMRSLDITTSPRSD